MTVQIIFAAVRQGDKMTAAQVKAARRKARLRNRHKAKVPIKDAFGKAEKKGKKR